MSVFEVVSGGDRRSLIKRFERKSKHDAVCELVDFHLLNCTRIEKLEAEAQALREEVAALREAHDKEWRRAGMAEENLKAVLGARVVVIPDVRHSPYVASDRAGNTWAEMADDESGEWINIERLARLNGKAVSEGLLRGLAAFTLELVRGAGEGCSFDGAEIQEGAERHGLLTKRVMERPCCGPDDGYCSCAYCAEFPTECYQIKPELRDLS